MGRGNCAEGGQGRDEGGGGGQGGGGGPAGGPNNSAYVHTLAGHSRFVASVHLAGRPVEVKIRYESAARVSQRQIQDTTPDISSAQLTQL